MSQRDLNGSPPFNPGPREWHIVSITSYVRVKADETRWVLLRESSRNSGPPLHTTNCQLLREARERLSLVDLKSSHLRCAVIGTSLIQEQQDLGSLLQFSTFPKEHRLEIPAVIALRSQPVPLALLLGSPGHLIP
ncbi:hypothetical protein Bbelb_059130 [Branchiostoma belcheri]|nr:hypothetical protein Bbelb_059130 [Branchiostoma belcheri]